jgi:hypothetical protein
MYNLEISRKSDKGDIGDVKVALYFVDFAQNYARRFLLTEIAEKSPKYSVTCYALLLNIFYTGFCSY